MDLTICLYWIYRSWGFLCPVHTPDGEPCGLLNHMTCTCRKFFLNCNILYVIVRLGPPKEFKERVLLDILSCQEDELYLFLALFLLQLVLWMGSCFLLLSLFWLLFPHREMIVGMLTFTARTFWLFVYYFILQNLSSCKIMLLFAN